MVSENNIYKNSQKFGVASGLILLNDVKVHPILIQCAQQYGGYVGNV